MRFRLTNVMAAHPTRAISALASSQAGQAWQAVRDGAVPTMQGAGDWLGERASDVREALDPTPPVAADPLDMILTGTFVSTDDDAPVVVVFDAATVTLDNQTLTTRPLRIAAGSDVFASDQTFAERLDARSDAQIELREVVPDDDAEPVAPFTHCGGAAPSALALLHRQNIVDLMLFPQGTGTALLGEPCAVLTLRAQ